MSSERQLDLERQSGLIPTDRVSNMKVTIIGAGAIGSHVAKQLCQIGIRELKVFDFDSIEPHNLPNQGFGLPDLGKNKALALKERLELDYGAQVVAVPERVDENTRFDSEVVVSAVDSMKARKAIWSVVNGGTETALFVDARMGALYAEVYAVNMLDSDSIESYDGSLFDDDEAYQAPCTEKSTIFCAAGTSAVMSSLVADFAGDKLKARKVEIDWARKVMS